MQLNKNIDFDFNRKIWCILGLPFDELNFKNTLNLINLYIQKNKQGVISTLNVNFVINALKNSSFKESVLQGELNIIDSMPILWTAKFLGFPYKETVTGSSLIQYLHSNKNKNKYSIFWFGGKEGAAKKASIKTKNHQSLKLAGYYNPGFGPVKKLSNEKIIEKINQNKPNLLLLALGAKKGASWINCNKNKLNANIISHIGAAMNFISEDIKRAPKWMQKYGLEWLWRIKEEPKLWKRYFNDGLILIKLFFQCILPYKLFIIKNKKYYLIKEDPVINIKENKSKILIKIKGICNNLNLDMIKNNCKKVILKNKDIIIDFYETKYIDNSFLGILFLLIKYQKINNKRLEIKNLNKKLKRIFKLSLLKDLIGK
jgi:N-acetylglucosaminyldiphosphoundecaprenol N-acetyl-beta-D-mannosaminyltransferase